MKNLTDFDADIRKTLTREIPSLLEMPYPEAKEEGIDLMLKRIPCSALTLLKIFRAHPEMCDRDGGEVSDLYGMTPREAMRGVLERRGKEIVAVFFKDRRDQWQ